MDEKITNILAKCLEQIEQGASLEDCLLQYPQHPQELKELLETFLAVQDASVISPRPEFKHIARTRLINLLPTHKPVTFSPRARLNLQTKPNRRRFTMSLLARIAIVVALIGGSTTGVAFASTSSLPGDALYGVKTTIQDTQLAFSGDEKDIDLLLGFMGKNLEEADALMSKGRLDDAETALEEYEKHLKEMLQTRERISYEDAGSEDSLNKRIQTELQTQTQTMLKLQEKAEGSTKLQLKLKEAIQATEKGKTHGPSDGGPGEGGGSSGPGEPGGEGSGGKPEDAGSGSGSGGGSGSGEGKPEDSGSGKGSGGKGGKGEGGSESISDCAMGEDGFWADSEGYACECKYGEDGMLYDAEGLECLAGESGGGYGNGSGSGSGGKP